MVKRDEQKMKEVLRLSLFKLVSKEDVPKKFKPSVVASTLEPDLDELDKAIKANGGHVAPFTGALEISLKDTAEKIKADGEEVPKQLKQLVAIKLREWLKKNHYNKFLDLKTRGDRIYLEGR